MHARCSWRHCSKLRQCDASSRRRLQSTTILERPQRQHSTSVRWINALRTAETENSRLRLMYQYFKDYFYNSNAPALLFFFFNSLTQVARVATFRKRANSKTLWSDKKAAAICFFFVFFILPHQSNIIFSGCMRDAMERPHGRWRDVTQRAVPIAPNITISRSNRYMYTWCSTIRYRPMQQCKTSSLKSVAIHRNERCIYMIVKDIDTAIHAPRKHDLQDIWSLSTFLTASTKTGWSVNEDLCLRKASISPTRFDTYRYKPRQPPS